MRIRKRGSRRFGEIPAQERGKRRRSDRGQKVSALWVLGHLALIMAIIAAMILSRRLISYGTYRLNQLLLGALPACETEVLGEGEAVGRGETVLEGEEDESMEGMEGIEGIEGLREP